MSDAAASYQEAVAAAVAAVETARAGLEDGLLRTKAAFHADRTPENKEAYLAATAELQAARASERGVRGNQVTGDVVVTNVDANFHGGAIPVGIPAERVVEPDQVQTVLDTIPDSSVEG